MTMETTMKKFAKAAAVALTLAGAGILWVWLTGLVAAG